MRLGDRLSGIQTWLQRLFSRLGLRSGQRRQGQQELPLQLQRQREIIQSLQEEVEYLKLTTEARSLERSEELRVKARQMAQVEQAGLRFTSILGPQALLEGLRLVP